MRFAQINDGVYRGYRPATDRISGFLQSNHTRHILQAKVLPFLTRPKKIKSRYRFGLPSTLYTKLSRRGVWTILSKEGDNRSS
jgi:hypothetical protein